MSALNDRWGLLIMRDLLLGLTRFDDLQRSSGVTNATLSDRLKCLEASGLIERRRYQTRPDRYEYCPTPKGLDMALIMQALVQVGDKWRQRRNEGAPLRFVDANSGRALRLGPVDAETGEIVTAPKITVQAGPDADEIMQWRIARGWRIPS
ncbi:helix-turn-helix domain-containing protein [Asaia sp. As-1742]|uniref:winged helix-turn-helix transcriptional regulator n=1 Tax=Asaia sp. As-1742 TaxID=2608325 RepID=UPI001F039511|nr:helix-turn-helix domain-containing protein [Asaia sp. As-1742]